MFEEKLGQVLCETAEQMFFQEFEGHPEAAPPARAFWASISVHSPERFEVIVAAEEAAMRSAIEMVFCEEEVSDRRISDVVAELANTIAGSLSRHISDESTMDLSPPEKGLGALPESTFFQAYAGTELTFFVAIKPLREVA